MIIRHLIALCLILAWVPSTHGQQLPRMHGEFYVPHPIHDVQMDRIVIWLSLSEEQEEAVRRLRDGYERSWLQVLPDQRAKLIALNEEYEQEMHHRDDDTRRFNLKETVERMLAIVDRMRAAMANHDDAFIADIAALTTPAQMARLPRVKRWRQRDSLRRQCAELADAGALLPDFIRPDTARTARQFSANEPPYVEVTRAEDDLLQAVMEQYEISLIAALRQLAESRRASSIANQTYMDRVRSHRANEMTRTTHPDEFHALDQLSKEITEPLVAPIRELDRVNDLGLQLLTSVLPDDKAERLRDIYQTQVAPVVYPDPASAELLYDAAGTIQSFGDELRQSLEDMRMVFASEHPLHCDRMVAAERNRRDMRWMHPRDYQIRAQAWADLAERGFEREALNQQQCTLAAQMLPPDQLARLIIAVWDAEYIRRADILAARSRRIRSTAPTRIITAWLLRAIPSNAQRQQVLTIIAGTISDDLPDDVAARRRELLTWDFQVIEPKRPWYSQTWLDRHARYEQGIFNDLP